MAYSNLRILSIAFDPDSNRGFLDDGVEGWGDRDHFEQPAGWNISSDPWLEDLDPPTASEDDDLDEDEDYAEDDYDDEDYAEDDSDDDLDYGGDEDDDWD